MKFMKLNIKWEKIHFYMLKGTSDHNAHGLSTFWTEK